MSWIQTLGGRKASIQKIDPEIISIEEIAIVLSRLCRFGGHCTRFYSVAEHSVRVSRLVPQELKLAGLLHDAHEVYSGFGDVCSPAKRLCPYISEIESAIDVVMAKRFDFDPSLFKRPEIRHADLVMLATEARDLMLLPPEPWADKADPLRQPIHEPLTLHDFLAEYRKLTNV